MQNAEAVLAVLRERGRKGLPCDELYRQMFNKSLYLLAYYCNGSCGVSWDADARRAVMITAWSILPGGLSRWTRWWS